MPGSIITYPLNGATNWENFTDIVQRLQLGYMWLSLTNFSNDSAPQIAAGSTLDINGAVATFTLAESITGWGAIASNTNVWIKVVESSGSVTAEYTTTAPTWDDAKHGWYDGNDRYIGGLYKVDASTYRNKWLYSPFSTERIYARADDRPLNTEKTITITASYTIVDTSVEVVLVNNTAALTVTLPAAANNAGRIITIKKISTDVETVTVDGNASETIDGDLTQEFADLTSLQLICDGSSWHII